MASGGVEPMYVVLWSLVVSGVGGGGTHSPQSTSISRSLVHSAGELLYTPSRIPTSMATVREGLDYTNTDRTLNRTRKTPPPATRQNKDREHKSRFKQGSEREIPF